MAADFASIAGLWLGGLFTIIILSIIYRDNMLFKFAEHTFVGLAAGHAIVYSVDNVLRYGWAPFSKGAYISGVGLVLGAMLYFRFLKGLAWIGRIPLTLIVGVGVGVGMRTMVGASFIDQIVATAKLSLWIPGDSFGSFNNVLFLIIVVTSMYYFIFTMPRMHAGRGKIIDKIGTYAIMASFGYAFGETVLSRFQMLQGRFDFLADEWIVLPYAAVELPVILAAVVYAMIPADKRPFGKRKQ